MGASVVQYMEINKCNTSHKQKERQNNRIISVDAEKASEKVHHSFVIKTLRKREERDYTSK